MADFKKMLKNLIFFQESEKVEKFILKENEFDREKNKAGKNDDKESTENEEEAEDTPKSTKSNKKGIKKLFEDSSEEDRKKRERKKKNKESDEEEQSDKISKEIESGLQVSRKLSENLAFMKKVYNIPTNGDVIIREFDIIFHEKPVEAFIIFIDGMTDRKVINSNILQPLMVLSNMDIKGNDQDVGEFVRKHLLPQNQLKITKKYKDIIAEINFGGCGIFVDGSEIAFAADVKGWEHRGVERPNTELVIRGPQEGFTEVLRANTALVRKILKDEDLIVENIEIGKRSKTPCSMLYLKDIANDSLVREVRRRLKSIKVDYLIDSGELEQLIEDNTYLPAPQMIATERPDKTAAHISEGKVVVMVHGSPYALIAPATLLGLINTPEDSYLRFPFANFIRWVRISGILLSLLLPGIYVAITNFHQEMIPTDLLFAIEASRERVPFPSVIEILIMEFSFELIREAGIRIPGPIGPTLGIIGALILGQAAVAANIVSPILIIVVAVTGIGSFAIPNFSLGFGFRILRFAYIFLGAMAGFLGITLGIFIHALFFVNARSFGVPFMSPFTPKTAEALNDALTRAPVWKQERRPDYLNTKDDTEQPHISRGWVEEDIKRDTGEDEGAK